MVHQLGEEADHAQAVAHGFLQGGLVERLAAAFDATVGHEERRAGRGWRISLGEGLQEFKDALDEDALVRYGVQFGPLVPDDVLT